MPHCLQAIRGAITNYICKSLRGLAICGFVCFGVDGCVYLYSFFFGYEDLETAECSMPSKKPGMFSLSPVNI